MPDPDAILEATADATRTVGRALATAGRWIGRKAADGWEAIDPDLRAHLAQLPVVGLTQLSARGSEVDPVPDDGHNPIVFVHGFGGAPGNFLPLRAWMWMKGRKRTYAFEQPGEGSLEEAARVLSAYVQALLEVNALPPERRVDLVAHSMGGVVARLALDDRDTRSRVATLVTLGSPHAGSHLARYGNTTRILDLRPGSAAMTRLEAQMPWAGPPDWPRLVTFWSPADVIVIPAESARVEGAVNIELPGFTHYSYLVRAECWRRVHDALAEE
jgi:pimeloyl-ACP methyl ester carboxylesterase